MLHKKSGEGPCLYNLVRQIAKMRERVAPNVVNRIRKMHSFGVHSVHEVGRHLTQSKGGQVSTDIRRRFTPDDRAVRNILSTERNGARLALDDQQNLSQLVLEWTKRNPLDFIYFQVSPICS